mgnify:CR=1 FL=1
MKYILLGFFSLLMMNIIIQSSYPYFGCMDMSITNIFRGNLFCVAFTNINYHVQTFQIHFYLGLAGYFLQKANTFVNEYLKVKID